MGRAAEDLAGPLARAEAPRRAGEADAEVAELSAAIRSLTAAGQCRQAAMACVRLGDVFGVALGNITAARAWYTRARRLLEDEPPCVEQGWVAVAGLGCDVDDPADLLGRAELALERARRFGDVNLEAKALADAGLAHVQAGRADRGMTLLDEAMALACGPVDDAETASRSVCSLFTACYYAGDFGRAESWAEVLRRQGLLGPAPGAPLFVSSHCDAVRATALCELGRWREAEAVLVRAIEAFEAGLRIPAWHPAIALAELRIRQGRLAEAEGLLLGKDGSLQALLPAARLHLARGDLALARATAARGLRAIGADCLRAADLLAVLVEVELAAGDAAAAGAACEQLAARAAALAGAGLGARVALARARAAAAAGDGPAAVVLLERALEAAPGPGGAVARAGLHVELVRLHDRAGDRAAATVEAARAAAALAGLEVVLAPADAGLLARCRAAARVGSEAGAPVTADLCREGSGWVAACAGTRVRLGDSKGLRYLAELLARPGTERHVLDLVDAVAGVAPAGDPAPDRRRLGDAGELADARARAAYRRRVEVLRAEVGDALAAGAEERAEALQDELDALVAELARAFGLGGRSRRAASAAERARLNVTRALRAATARLSELLPEGGAALDRRLRTGTYCAYEPHDGDELRWVFSAG